jgi:hypothetical protein
MILAKDLYWIAGILEGECKSRRYYEYKSRKEMVTI